MKKILTYYHQLLLTKAARKLIDTSDVNQARAFLQRHPMIPGKPVLSTVATNELIVKLIESGEPFMAGRIGANELSTIKTFDFQFKSKYEKQMLFLSNGAGFFPPTSEAGMQFVDLMKASIPYVDLIAVWMIPFYGYFLKQYTKPDVQLTYLSDFEPWYYPSNPWSSALSGKTVLVIHPFVKTIEQQYRKRELLFQSTNILPAFKLKTLQAVQTIAGETDNRFETWFDALDWMEQEALKMDFDIAIIGCGAYGFPLAARLKNVGKQAIHLAGATQLLFGIRGKRWDTDKPLAIKSFFNDDWVYPDASEKPKDARTVEGGCYWQ